MTNPNDPVTPTEVFVTDGMGAAGDLLSVPGLTKREWFAGLALQTIVTQDSTCIYDPAKAAMYAVKLADALIADLNVSGKS